MPSKPAWRILLVDDEPDILAVLGMTLTDAGYAVKNAADGAAGLASCRADQPHIVITDLRMPHKDGLQLLSEIKTSYPAVEVIVATAFGDMASAVRALQLDASDFITKPIAADALLVAVERAKARILTRRKLQEDQINLLHRDKMMSLGHLAASVAHEINNPLSGVLNYVRLMNRTLGDQGPTAEQRIKFSAYLDTVEKEVARCCRIVSNLLTFSRKSEPIQMDADVGDLLKRSAELCGHRLALSQITVAFEIDQSPIVIKADPNQLQQCLINLIFNGADAMPAGGRLVLTAHADKEHHCAVIRVSDTGCGIADEHLAHIFEPFFTTKPAGQGTGLGLATTYGIIEQHRGTISVDTRVDSGTTFTISLPEGSDDQAHV